MIEITMHFYPGAAFSCRSCSACSSSRLAPGYHGETTGTVSPSLTVTQSESVGSLLERPTSWGCASSMGGRTNRGQLELKAVASAG